MNSVLERTEKIKEGQKQELIMQLLTILAILMLTAIVVSVSYVMDKRSKTIVSVEDVGALQSATYNAGTANETTTVTTEKGTFLVLGILQLVTGHKAELQVMANNTRRLCDTTTDTCRALKE